MSMDNLCIDSFIKNLAKKAKETNLYEVGDYTNENGLLFCGKCDTPKECEISINGMTAKVSCLCKCKEEKEKQKKEQIEKENKQREIRHNTYKAFTTPKQKEIVFEKAEDIPQLKPAIRWADDFNHKIKGLLFFGSKGTGKTYLANCIANAVLNKGYSVKMTDFAEIGNQMQSTFKKDEYIENLNKYSLLIIDDLGIERKTDYMKEIAFNVINSRYIARLPLIVTTNLTLNELTKCEDVERARIYDRIIEMCLPVEFKGESFRIKKARKEFKQDREKWGF